MVVEDGDAGAIGDLDAWYRGLQSLGPAVYERGECKRVQAILDEVDEQAKALVRREMVVDEGNTAYFRSGL